MPTTIHIAKWRFVSVGSKFTHRVRVSCPFLRYTCMLSCQGLIALSRPTLAVVTWYQLTNRISDWFKRLTLTERRTHCSVFNVTQFTKLLYEWSLNYLYENKVDFLFTFVFLFNAWWWLNEWSMIYDTSCLNYYLAVTWIWGRARVCTSAVFESRQYWLSTRLMKSTRF